MRITDADVDQARAAGVLIEFAQGRPIGVDRALDRELVKGAISRTHDDLEARAAAAAKEETARASNLDVARFRVCALLGADHDKSPHSQSGSDRAHRRWRRAAGRQRAAHATRGSGDGGQAQCAAGRADRPGHGARLDLGNALIHILTTVDPGDT